LLGYSTNEHGYRVFKKTIDQVKIAIDVTFDETDDSQKEQVNVDIVGKEDPSSQVIKKLATGEVKPVEDDDEYAQVQIIHDPFMHHGSINAHDDGSTSRSGHDSSVQVIQSSPQVEDNNQVDDQNRSEDNST
jgi:hypothetical protein